MLAANSLIAATALHRSFALVTRRAERSARRSAGAMGRHELTSPHFPWMNSPMSLDICSSEPWWRYIMCPAG
jgi:hypothetical protein